MQLGQAFVAARAIMVMLSQPKDHTCTGAGAKAKCAKQLSEPKGFSLCGYRLDVQA